MLSRAMRISLNRQREATQKNTRWCSHRRNKTARWKVMNATTATTATTSNNINNSNNNNNNNKNINNNSNWSDMEGVSDSGCRSIHPSKIRPRGKICCHSSPGFELVMVSLTCTTMTTSPSLALNSLNQIFPPLLVWIGICSNKYRNVAFNIENKAE